MQLHGTYSPHKHPLKLEFRPPVSFSKGKAATIPYLHTISPIFFKTLPRNSNKPNVLLNLILYFSLPHHSEARTVSSQAALPKKSLTNGQLFPIFSIFQRKELAENSWVHIYIALPGVINLHPFMLKITFSQTMIVFYLLCRVKIKRLDAIENEVLRALWWCSSHSSSHPPLK